MTSTAPRLVFELHLPEPPPSNTAIKGMHFHAYRTLRKAWRASVLDALGGTAPASPIALSRLEVERHSAGGGLDWDNAYGGLKPLLDCLVAPSARNPDGLGLIADDNTRNMPEAPVLRQLAAKRGAGSTVVRIYELES